jgi:hypothetical protein
MKRRIWGPVIVTSVVLVVAGLVPRTSWRDLGPRAGSLARAATVAAQVAVRQAAPRVAQGAQSAAAALAAAAVATREAAARLDAGGAAAVSAVSAAALMALLAWAIARRPADRHRHTRSRVIRLARRGGEAARIARRTGLARDAVRMALRPELALRRGAAESSAQVFPLPRERELQGAAVPTGPMRPNDLRWRPAA